MCNKNLQELEQQLTSSLTGLHKWLIDNRLSLLLGKMEALLFASKTFASKRKLRHKPTIHITCNGTNINHVSEANYLGCNLDSQASGELMAKKIINKCNSRLKFLYKHNSYLSQSSRHELLSNALIM